MDSSDSTEPQWKEKAVTTIQELIDRIKTQPFEQYKKDFQQRNVNALKTLQTSKKGMILYRGQRKSKHQGPFANHLSPMEDDHQGVLTSLLDFLGPPRAQEQIPTSIMFSLIDVLISLDNETFLVPLFENIYFHKINGNAYIDILSLSGLSLFNDQHISTTELKRLLPFLDSLCFKSQKPTVNYRRAYAVLLLGLILETPIQLHCNKYLKDTVNFKEAKDYVSKNRDQFKSLLSEQQSRDKIAAVDEAWKTNFKGLFNQLLIEEQDITWSQIIFDTFIKPQELKEANWSNFIQRICQTEWKALEKGERKRLIENKIISGPIQRSLTGFEADCFLTFSKDITFKSLTPFRGSFSIFLEVNLREKDKRALSKEMTTTVYQLLSENKHLFSEDKQLTPQAQQLLALLPNFYVNKQIQIKQTNKTIPGIFKEEQNKYDHDPSQMSSSIGPSVNQTRHPTYIDHKPYAILQYLNGLPSGDRESPS